MNTQLLFCLNFFHKMATSGHFGWPKITFDRISRHFRSIRNFFEVLHKVRFATKTIGFFHYVLSMAMPNIKLIGEFMTKLEQPQAFWAFLYKMAARGHFVFPIDAKNHLGPQWLWRIWIWLVYLWQSYGLYKRWRAAETAAQPNTQYPDIFKFRWYNYQIWHLRSNAS